MGQETSDILRFSKFRTESKVEFDSQVNRNDLEGLLPLQIW